MQINYPVSELIDHINWAYLYYAWSVPPTSEAARKLTADSERLLAHLMPYTTVRALVELFDCNSEGDDILLHTGAESAPVRLPMLRQQQAGADGHCLCLADFVRPLASGQTDRIGMFATSVVVGPHEVSPVSRHLSFTPLAPTPDDYRRLLLQTVSDRLAEAAAERLHMEVRRRIWGYAPDERLSMADLHAERHRGIRPAVGYPSLPDLSFNFLIDQLLHLSAIGIQLTEHGMMQPHASVSGLMFALPQSRYFSVGQISEQQFLDYARRRQWAPDRLRPYLAANIA